MSYFHFVGGQRDKWRIKVSASKLKEACEERGKYHQDRMEFWEKERDKADARLRKEGLTFEQHQVSGGVRTEAKLDPELQYRLGECVKRLEHNKGRLAEFQAFKAFFELSGASEFSVLFELGADDVLYFNLQGADPNCEGDVDQ